MADNPNNLTEFETYTEEAKNDIVEETAGRKSTPNEPVLFIEDIIIERIN